MFNIDKILKRSLSSDIVSMRKKYKYCIEIKDESDILYIFLNKKELKIITHKDSVGIEYMNIPNDKIQHLFKEYRKLNINKKLLDIKIENLTEENNINEESIYEIIWNNNLEKVTFKELKEYANQYSQSVSINSINSYGSEFVNLFTEDELRKIETGKVSLFISRDSILIVSSTQRRI